MKKQTVCENSKIEQFEIREPIWTVAVCLLAAIGFFVGAVVTFCWVSLGKIEKEYIYVGALLIFFSLVCAWGAYIWTFKKFTYADRVYTYYHWYGKKQIAKVSEISKVKFLTRLRWSRYGLKTTQHVFFYNNKKEILIKCSEGDWLCKNELFLRSLKANRIKIIREEKWMD